MSEKNEKRAEREALLAELDWSIDNGMHGQRTCETLKRARAALAQQPQGEPVYDKSVVKRLAMQMGLIPEQAAPVAQGLTNEQIEKIASQHGLNIRAYRALDADVFFKAARAILAQAAPRTDQGEDATAAARDVLAERQRQISAEGWTPEHDDEHDDSEMALAASWYAASPFIRYELDEKGLGFWPWSQEWWKPGDRRRELVKAGALILAEIERIDRAAMSASKEGA